MTNPALTVGCFEYDTTRALFDGSVREDGIDVTMGTAATLPEIFDRLIRGNAFDVAELGLTFYLRLLDTGLPYVAMPIFPNACSGTPASSSTSTAGSPNRVILQARPSASSAPTARTPVCGPRGS